MNKRGLLSLGLFFLGFVSAYNGSPFSIQNMLNSLDPSTAILGSIFILSFALIFLALINFKKFGENRGIAAIISFCTSFLIIYGMYRSSFDYENFYYDLFYNIGLSGDVASMLIPLILILGAVLVVWKFDFSTLLISFGSMMILASVFGFVYEQLITMIIGGVFVVIGLVVKKNIKLKK